MLYLTRENVVDYVKEHTELFSKDAVLTVHKNGDAPESEDGDGYVNHIFIVRDGTSSCCVKQSTPKPRYADSLEDADDVTFPTERSKLEADALMLRGALCPSRVPKLYYADHVNCIFIMEDLSHLRIMRFALNEMHYYPKFPRQIAEYFATCNFYTSLEYMTDSDFRMLTVKYTSPELMNVMERVKFLPPDGRHFPSTFDVDERNIGRRYFEDKYVLKELIAMRNKYMRTKECLMHSDLHTSNIFIGDDDVKVFDMEFTCVGPEAHDMGYLISNCISEYSAFHYRNDLDADDAAHFRMYLLAKLHDIFTCYSEIYTDLFDRHAKPEYRVENYVEDKLKAFEYDMIGYAACANLTRAGGLAGYPDFDVIANRADRLNAKALSMAIDGAILKNHKSIDTVERLIDLMAACAKECKANPAV